MKYHLISKACTFIISPDLIIRLRFQGSPQHDQDTTQLPDRICAPNVIHNLNSQSPPTHIPFKTKTADVSLHSGNKKLSIGAGLHNWKWGQVAVHTLTREADLTCQSQDCVPVASSHTHEHWVHPNWRRSSGGWSQANERHRVPLVRREGRFLLREGASVVVASGETEMETLWFFYFDFFLSARLCDFHSAVLSVCTSLFRLSLLPPGCLYAAGISVPPLPLVGHRSYKRAVTRPGCLSPG